MPDLRDVAVDAARERMLALAVRTRPETVALADALGRTLAETITASRDQPPFAASAMDGWAVRGARGGERLRILGESAAGKGFDGGVQAGEAVRIFTGAPVPRGADAVVIQENTAREDGVVVINEAAASGANIRVAGGDFRQGDVLLQPGVRIDAWRLSLAAAAGRASLSVAAAPRVAILSTGEEIVPPGGEPGPYQIFNSGGPALAALARRWGAASVVLAPAGDNEAAIREAVASADCDVVVTIGGASVGDHDVVKPALSKLGLELSFETLKMRPGKPTWFGILADGRRVLGLPGNPASALACAELFLHPLVAAMQGGDPRLPMRTAIVTHGLPANGPREHWMRARLNDGEVTPFGDQDSSLVTVFASADALLRRAVGAPAVAVGESVEVLVLDRL